MKIPTDCAENLAVTMCGGRLKPHVVDGGCDTIRFEGIEDATVNQGVGIDLRDGITAYDGDGNEIEYEVEPSELAPCEVGEFDIEYRASGKGLTMKPTVCGRNKVHAVDCGLDTVVEHRLITVTQADPPTISGVGETVIDENTDFDPLDGVSAVDDNGNVLEVEYSGKYLQEANGGIASFESEYEDPLHSLKVSLEPIQPCTPWMGSEEYNNPYLMQAMPTISEAYNTEYLKKVVGGTVAWNQLVPTASRDYINAGTESYSGIIFFFRLNASPYTQFYSTTRSTTGLFAFVKKATATGKAEMIHNGIRTQMKFANNIDVVENHYYLGMINFTSLDASTVGGVVAKDIQLIDLTQMFGSTIADYIYSLEQANSGDGVTFFKALFPNDYYPYNSGELLSVQTSAHVTKDGNEQQIASYPLDADLTLRGIPKLDAQNNLYYDGDEYKSDGSVARRYGIVDLGTLNWSKYTADDSGNSFYVNVPSNAKLVTGRQTLINAICSKYIIAVFGGSVATWKVKDKALCQVDSAQRWIIRDSAFTDTTAFKNSLSGVYLVYELATPTTESASPYTSQQSVDDGGTEEFVSSNVVPVGHVSSYARVCPISGHTDVVTHRTGKNLFEHNTIAVYSYTFAIQNTFEQMVNPFFMRGGNTYVLSIDSGNTLYRMRAFDSNHELITDNSKINATSDRAYITYYSSYKFFGYDGGASNNITVFRPTEDMWFDAVVQSTSPTQVMLELGSTATDYEPYQGTTYTTDLGQTVYGGTLDIVSGELTIDRAMVDLGSLNWSRYTADSTSHSFVVSAKTDAKESAESLVPSVLCSQYSPTAFMSVASWTSKNGVITQVSGPQRWIVRDENYTDATAFKTAMSGVQLVYELAEPQTIQLTPQEVRTLLGQNNVWSDGIYHPLVKRYLKDNSWVGRYINGVMYYVNNGYGYLHTDTFKDASVSCSHFAVKKFVSKPTDTSTPLADNALYLTDDGSLYARYDAIEDADPTVSLQNWIDFVTDNNVFMTVPSYSDTASDSLDLTLQYNAPIPQGEAYKYIAQGTYTVTYRAVDQCGNETEVTRNITVGENIPVRRTVLRQDGTLVINELASEYYANNEIYGAITHEYEPYDENNRYIFSSNNDIPWYAEQNSITGVVIGEDIYPTSINMWFYNLQNAVTWELARLHTENTTSMIRAFAHSDVTNLHLDELDTSNVTTMESMFFTAKSSQPFVALLDTSSCENFSSMFSNGASSGFAQIDVSSFDVSNAKNMVGMFFRCDRLTELDLSNFIPTECEDFSNMFSNCTNLEHLNLLNFHTPSAINMEGMFSQCKHLEELDLSAFDTSNVVNMAGMFAGTVIHDAVDFTGFDTSNVDNFTAMFAQASVGGDEHYLDLSTWDTSNAVNMNQMFVTASIGILNIANFTTPNVTNVNLMFANSSSQMLQTVYCNNDFDLTNVGSNVQMFGNNPNLVGGNGTTYDASRTTSEYARLDNPPSAPGYFTVAPDSDITNEEDIEITNEDDEPITT